jgi:hypothetical protein
MKNLEYRRSNRKKRSAVRWFGSSTVQRQGFRNFINHHFRLWRIRYSTFSRLLPAASCLLPASLFEDAACCLLLAAS